MKIKKGLICLIFGVCIGIGGVTWFNHVTNPETKYMENHIKSLNNEENKIEMIADSLKAKLNENLYFKVLDSTATFEYTHVHNEKVEWKIPFIDKKLTVSNPEIIRVGTADAYFEFGTYLDTIKVDVVGDKDIDLIVKRAILNEESVHRVKNTYVPNNGKSSKNMNAETKIMYELKEGSQTMVERADIAWEDGYDIKVVGFVKDLYSNNTDRISELENATISSVKGLVDTMVVSIIDEIGYIEGLNINVKLEEETNTYVEKDSVVEIENKGL